MNDRKLLRTGVVGAVVAAVCCFTPLLVVLFGALGLSALMGWWLDVFVLYPALAFFFALTLYAFHRIKRSALCASAVAGTGPRPKQEP